MIEDEQPSNSPISLNGRQIGVVTKTWKTVMERSGKAVALMAEGIITDPEVAEALGGTAPMTVVMNTGVEIASPALSRPPERI